MDRKRRNLCKKSEVIMTSLTIVDLLKYLYPGELEARRVQLGQDDDGVIRIKKWAIPNIEQPSEATLSNLLQQHERTLQLNTFLNHGTEILDNLITQTAKNKGYDSPVSCVSYLTSSVFKWSEEAAAFSAWRDSVHLYAQSIYNNLLTNNDPIPELSTLVANAPAMVWPNA